jgi:hypothetical protein
MMPAANIGLLPLLRFHFRLQRRSSDDEGPLKMIVTLKRWVLIATTIFMVVTPLLENEHDAGR